MVRSNRPSPARVALLLRLTSNATARRAGVRAASPQPRGAGREQADRVAVPARPSGQARDRAHQN